MKRGRYSREGREESFITLEKQGGKQLEQGKIWGSQHTGRRTPGERATKPEKRGTEATREEVNHLTTSNTNTTDEERRRDCNRDR